MKSIITVFFTVILTVCTFISNAQMADTIYTIRNEKIACKVHEIGQVEIKYKKMENLDGPFYTVLRERVRSIKYANGFEEMILPDEMDVHKEEPIMHKRSVVKLELFSPIFDVIAIGYERVWKPGINFEAKAGFINNTMFPFSFSNNGAPNDLPMVQGGYGKVGIKLLLGSHTYTPGTKYRHPLHGGYFGLYLGQTAFTERGLKFYKPYMGPYPYPYPYPYYPDYILTDRKVGATSITIMYGNQFVLANTLTLGIAIGAGYSINYSKYTNPEVYDILRTQYYGYEEDLPNEMYSHVMLFNDRAPVCLSGNFTIGYILK